MRISRGYKAKDENEDENEDSYDDFLDWLYDVRVENTGIDMDCPEDFNDYVYRAYIVDDKTEVIFSIEKSEI